MKILKILGIFLGVLVILGVILFNTKIGQHFYNAYKFSSSLSGTVLDEEITKDDNQKAADLKTGAIYSQKHFELKDMPAFWDNFSENGEFKEKYKYLEQVDFSIITYKSDSQLIHGIVAAPKKEGKYPVVLFNKGGNKEVGKIAAGKTLYTMLSLVSKLASEGYVIIGSCYRENDEFGGRDINDVLALTETAKEMDNADASRIGMLGWSRGGMMTYLALKNSDAIKTAVVGNGPTNLLTLAKERPEMEKNVYSKLIPNYDTQKEEQLTKRSAIFWPEQLSKNSSLLILSGSQDENVNPQQAQDIAEKLTALDYNFKHLEFDTDHGFKGKHDELYQTLTDWFGEKL